MTQGKLSPVSLQGGSESRPRRGTDPAETAETSWTTALPGVPGKQAEDPLHAQVPFASGFRPLHPRGTPVTFPTWDL